MSIYICGFCDEYKDVDMHGCCENPKDEFSCICEECEVDYQYELENSK